MPHNVILKRTNCESIEALLSKRALRWVGDVKRMPDERLTKRVLYSELVEGARRPVDQKKRYKDHIKRPLKACNISPNNFETIAVDWARWGR